MTALGAFLAGLQKPGMVWTGQVSSVEPFTVRYGATDVPCVQHGSWTPVVGAEVRVENVGGRAIATGMIWPHARPDVVTVLDEEAYTPDANNNPVLFPGHLTAEANGHQYAIRYLPGYVPTVGDQIAVSWSTPRGLAIGVAAAAVGAPPPPPPARGEAGVSHFRALDAGSFRGGKWRTDRGDVIQGDHGGHGQNHGAFFYGGAIQTLAGATIKSIKIRLNRERGGAQYGPPGEAVNLYRHTAAHRPAGDVARVAGPHTVRMPLGVDWRGLPASFGQALADEGGGIAISGGSYAVLAALGTDPESGLLEVEWERVW